MAQQNFNMEETALVKLTQSVEVKSMPERDSLQVTICASFVIEPLQDYLDYWSKEFGLNINLSFAPYNQVFQQLLNPQSLFNQAKGLKILFIRIEDWLRDLTGTTISEQHHFLTQTYSEFAGAINQARKNTGVPLLIGIVPLSPSHSFSSEIAASIAEMNRELEAALREIPSFYLLDLSKIATLYAIEETFDPKSDELGHMPFTPEYYAALGTFLTRKVRAYKTPSYKVIALDCDNTLWKG
ncbi:MAG TPA: hypothetical protein VM888_14985, partial [Chitinophagaceae bacterium]|nr:hypothetical protein [Chitinophagaceae bacterium]